jgi:aerobic carbon-monoxide dehydrogenase small subunit
MIDPPRLPEPVRLSYRLLVDEVGLSVADAPLAASLLTVLRDHLGITSVKDACEQGRCGACSVLVDGTLLAACTVLAADVTGTRITTVAGLPDDGPAPAVRRAFLEHGAVQCGFCTPGFVVAVTDLLSRHPAATDDEVRETLAGNICRCTGYGRILAAVRAAARATAVSAEPSGPAEPPGLAEPSGLAEPAGAAERAAR